MYGYEVFVNIVSDDGSMMDSRLETHMLHIKNKSPLKSIKWAERICKPVWITQIKLNQQEIILAMLITDENI